MFSSYAMQDIYEDFELVNLSVMQKDCYLDRLMLNLFSAKMIHQTVTTIHYVLSQITIK